ncbi:MAG TPA: hypothetical protein VFT17_07610, partial [Propionibacteriaceae bacterium]|nr:hypothetical protein [Propionibacteriaceae bacterium]
TEVIDGGDRRSAIRLALQLAKPGDVVAILGKGHELGQEVAGTVLRFSDPVVAAEEWVVLHPNEAAHLDQGHLGQGHLGQGPMGQGEADQDRQGAPP